MSRSTISTFELFALFPDEEIARVYLEGRIWPNGPVCPVDPKEVTARLTREWDVLQQNGIIPQKVPTAKYDVIKTSRSAEGSGRR